MNSTLAFVLTHYHWVLWPLVSALLSLAFRKKSPEDWQRWALTKPALALVVDLVRATGLDLPKILVAVKRYADRRAGEVPADIWASLPLSPTLRAALRDPDKRALIEAREVPEDVWALVPVAPALKAALRNPETRALLEATNYRGQLLALAASVETPPASTPLTPPGA